MSLARDASVCLVFDPPPRPIIKSEIKTLKFAIRCEMSAGKLNYFSLGGRSVVPKCLVSVNL